MKIVNHKSLEEQRSLLKKEIWKRFCKKEFPRSLSSKKFLTIFFKEAEKTYSTYVRYYASINWVHTSLLQKKLLYLEDRFSKLSEDICRVTSFFSAEIKSIKTKEKADNFYIAVKEFHDGVITDLVLIDKSILTEIKRRVFGSAA